MSDGKIVPAEEAGELDVMLWQYKVGAGGGAWCVEGTIGGWKMGKLVAHE